MNRSIKCLLLLSAAVGWGCEQQSPPPASKQPVDAPATAPPPRPASKSQPAAPPTAPPAAKGDAALPPGHPAVPAAPQPAGADKADPHAGLRDPHAGMNMTKPVPADPHASTGSGKPAAQPHPGATVLEGITLKVPEGWVAEEPEAAAMPQLGAKAVFRLAAVESDDAPAFVRVTHFPEMKGKDDFNLDRWYGQFTQPDDRPTKEVSKVENFEVGDVKVVLADIPGTTNVGGVAKPNQRMVAAIVNHPRGPHFIKVLGPDKTVAHWRESVVAYLKSVQITAAGASKPAGSN